MIFNRKIAFTYSWWYSFLIGSIIGALLASILIFLQPFDTYSSEMPYKNLRLAGYAICIILPILLIHFFENYWYKQQSEAWFLWNEVIILSILLSATIISSYFYNVYLINKLTPTWENGWDFFVHFGLPLAIFLLPIWIYLRFSFGEVNVKENSPGSELLTIKGDNTEDELTLTFSDFVLARSQQNYVDLYYLDQEQQVRKKVIRSTLANLSEQLPQAYRIHRSYLVNLSFVRSVEGNARKRFLEVNHMNEQVPVSQKYYNAIREHLQIHPEKG